MRQGLCLLACTYLTITPLFALDYRVFPGVGSKEDWKRAYAYNDKGVTLFGTNPKEALSLINQAIAIYPHSSLFYSNAGSAAMTMKEYRKAADLYKRAVGLNGENVAALSGLGAAYLELGALAEAEKFCKRGLSIDPQDKASAINLAEVYIKTHRVSQGRTLLLNLQSKSSDADELKEIRIWLEKANRLEGK